MYSKRDIHATEGDLALINLTRMVEKRSRSLIFRQAWLVTCVMECFRLLI